MGCVQNARFSVRCASSSARHDTTTMNELTRFLLAVRAGCASAGIPVWMLCQIIALAAGLACFRPLRRGDWRVFASGTVGGLFGAFTLGPCLLLPQAIGGTVAW